MDGSGVFLTIPSEDKELKKEYNVAPPPFASMLYVHEHTYLHESLTPNRVAIKGRHVVRFHQTKQGEEQHLASL